MVCKAHRVNDSYTEYAKNLIGVPQGSLVGLLLLNVFLNDMDLALKVQFLSL